MRPTPRRMVSFAEIPVGGYFRFNTRRDSPAEGSIFRKTRESDGIHTPNAGWVIDGREKEYGYPRVNLTGTNYPCHFTRPWDQLMVEVVLEEPGDDMLVSCVDENGEITFFTMGLRREYLGDER